MEIHERIRGLREDHDKTQKEIAALLNTSPQYYQKYEKGIRPIPVAHLKTLALYYNVSLDFIVGIPDGMPYGHSKTKQGG